MASDFGIPRRGFGGPARAVAGDIQEALQQHWQARMGGAGSIAARNDPLQAGSVFARQNPGFMDLFREQERRQDPANLHYNGMQRRADGSASDTPLALSTSPAQPAPESATDRYARGMGYGAGANGGYDPTAAGTYYKANGGQGAYNPATGAVAAPASMPPSPLQRRTRLTGFEVG